MLHVTTAEQGSLVLRPSGVLCHFSLDPLRVALDGALDAGEHHLVVDLADVELLSAAAVGVLVSTALRCEVLGGRLRVAHAHGLVAEVVAILAPQLDAA